MKRFIRYLYEYEQGRRMRNVGFVKVEQGEDECMVHIHGKGLRMSGEKILQIYLLFEDGGTCYGIWQGEADNVNPAVNECISYTPEETGKPENYEKIGGVALENQDGRRYAALWDEIPMDVSGMKIWGADEEADEKESGEEEADEQETDEKELDEEESGEEETDEKELDEEESGEKGSDTKSGYTASDDAEPEVDEQEQKGLWESGGPDDMTEEIPLIASEDFSISDEVKNPRLQKRWRTKKIQRTEIARLARCEWRLANNNFLLHGYYNYHHLILLEREEQYLLGVPGIYHEKEAAAAGAFGFPEFIAKDRLEIRLSPEECNDDHPFGYWCRPVKRAFKWE